MSWTKQTPNATAYTKGSSVATAYTKQTPSTTSYNGYFIVDTVAIMDSTIYLMDATDATMDGIKISPNYAPAATWGVTSKVATAWT